MASDEQLVRGSRVIRRADARKGYPMGTVVRRWTDEHNGEEWAHIVWDAKRDGTPYLRPDMGTYARVRTLQRAKAG